MTLLFSQTNSLTTIALSTVVYVAVELGMLRHTALQTAAQQEVMVRKGSSRLHTKARQGMGGEMLMVQLEADNLE